MWEHPLNKCHVLRTWQGGKSWSRYRPGSPGGELEPSHFLVLKHKTHVGDVIGDLQV